jgi:FtsZ-interacting cell division protein YlmF
MVSDRAGNAFAHEAQIVQLRDRDECRAIMEHLKNNCTVALNMDNIA